MANKKDTQALTADERKRLRIANLLVNVIRSMSKRDSLDDAL